MPLSHINQCCPSDAQTILPSGEQAAPACPESVELLAVAGGVIAPVPGGVVGLLTGVVVTVAKPDIVTTMVPVVVMTVVLVSVVDAEPPVVSGCSAAVLTGSAAAVGLVGSVAAAAVVVGSAVTVVASGTGTGEVASGATSAEEDMTVMAEETASLETGSDAGTVELVAGEAELEVPSPFVVMLTASIKGHGVKTVGGPVLPPTYLPP